MMLYPAMSELLKQVPSRYKLVNVVAARARKIAAKAEREHIMLEDKPVSIAIREIAAGHLEDEEEPETQETVQAQEAAEPPAQEESPADDEADETETEEEPVLELIPDDKD